MGMKSLAATDVCRVLCKTPFVISFSVFCMAPTIAAAIPSPELVIGSVSSLSQVFAVAIAAVSGAGALMAKRFGFAPGKSGGSKRYPVRLILTLVAFAIVFAALNIWQFRSHQAQELARLQGTLVRPAQFEGTQIQDANLKEASFSNQSENSLAITTDQAQKLLDTQAEQQSVLFVDVRETSEHQMGTLPGAEHVRFPDFLQSDIPTQGKQVVLFCHNGNRSSETCAELAARGIDCRFIAGGIEKWIVEGRSLNDKEIKTLSDLRAIPEYANKDVLLSTQDFSDLQSGTDLQIVDTRYPGDFATGHLPGAINIPIRALPTVELNQLISQLEDKPTIAACYDRRSCFMSQVLGLEMSEAGIEFLGRYTTPWEYFIPPAPKPHVQNWLDSKQVSFWQIGVDKLSGVLVWIAERSSLVIGLFLLSLLTRLLVLPIALKSERDQIVTAQHSQELKSIKDGIKNDPTRKARAVQQFYASKGLSPMRNLIALLFLPVMMLGLSATELASAAYTSSFLWVSDLGLPDSTYILPGLFALMAGIYLHWAVAKSKKQAIALWVLCTPLLFAMVFGLSAAGSVYLCISMTLLLVQRAYVIGLFHSANSWVSSVFQSWKIRNLFRGVIPLQHTEALVESGNKSYRLSVLKNEGLPVPDGLVIKTEAIKTFTTMSKKQKQKFAHMVWQMINKKTCAVRSSAASEDGADQSYAGVFESVLDVEKNDMRNALDEVVASFSSDRAKSYDGTVSGGHDGNILVQHMVRSEYAGVLFTQDPLAPGLMMIELVKGCGDDLVSGRVTPQCLRFGRYTKLPVDDQTGPIDLGQLLKLGRQVEDTFGCPQDIEWAYADGAFKILQSRDITTLANGDVAELARKKEWQHIFERYQNAQLDVAILEQDEMSEVLPNPTPLSFSLMGAIWAPGGSLDIACRQLGVSYDLPEGRPGHLVSVFGRTYVDHGLKQQLALHLSGAKARQMRKRAALIIDQFRDETIPALAEDLAFWQAVNFAALPSKQIIRSISTLRDMFVNDIYVEAEKVNILAGFAMTEAETCAKHDADARRRLMHPVLKHAPVSLIGACAKLNEDAQKSAVLELMGHRAIFDYELSTPRYDEAPDLLWPLLESATSTSSDASNALASNPIDKVDLAVALQDLKEQAKHEALRVVALIRRAVVALADRTELLDDIFYLELGELLNLTDENVAACKLKAQARRARRELLLKQGPKQVSLTLHDCERLSSLVPLQNEKGGAGLSGTCVSGSLDANGRVFVVPDDAETDADAFAQFDDGDIIVCRMVSPAWLSFVQRSGGVLSEVGGWLSHMAIVAREKDILMLVGCSDLYRLETGQSVTVGTDGAIELVEPALSEVRKSA